MKTFRGQSTFSYQAAHFPSIYCRLLTCLPSPLHSTFNLEIGTKDFVLSLLQPLILHLEDH